MFGDNLRALRKKKGLSEDDMAERLGILSRSPHGERGLKFSTPLMLPASAYAANMLLAVTPLFIFCPFSAFLCVFRNQ